MTKRKMRPYQAKEYLLTKGNFYSLWAGARADNPKKTSRHVILVLIKSKKEQGEVLRSGRKVRHKYVKK